MEISRVVWKATRNLSINTSGICGIVGKGCQKNDLEGIASGMRVAKHANNREMYIDDSIGFYSFSSGRKGYKVVHNEDGTVVAIVNGEVSNAQEVKANLESQGHEFSSEVDHEVLVHVFEDLHVDPLAFRSVEGAFSFAVWDTPARKLLLGLDKFGMRKLYYSSFNGNLVFASEMKGIANHLIVPKSINPVSASLFLSYFYVPTEETLINGIKKILPATYKMFRVKDDPVLLNTTKYWRMNFSSCNLTTDTSLLSEEIYSTMLNSVKEKIEDDHSLVGVSLAGGLDSGLVTSLLRKLDQEVTAFVVAMEGGEQNAARLTAEYNESKVEEIFITGEDYIKNIGEVVGVLDEPIFDWALLAIFLIGQKARKHVDMLFTGDGGDETFWGYPWVPRFWFDPLLTSIPSNAKRAFDSRLGSKAAEELMRKPLLDGFSIGSIYEKISLPPSNIFFLECLRKCNPDDLALTSDQLRKKGQVIRVTNLTAPVDTCFKEVPVNDDLLRRYHALLTVNLAHGGAGIRPREMIYNYHGIKCNMPFLDESVIRLAYRIPSHLKQPSRFETKYIMRKMISKHRLLPEKIVKLRKRGFGDPLATWMRKDKSLRDFMFNTLDEGCRLGLMKKDFLNKAKNGTITPGRCFGIMTFIMWYKDFILGKR